jgi:rhodanese-related sulfurtransferase
MVYFLASTINPTDLLPYYEAPLLIRELADHIGGHIRHSIHAPSHTLDHKIPELVRKLKDKETVVFHCALSQQRGPSAALRWRVAVEWGRFY